MRYVCSSQPSFSRCGQSVTTLARLLRIAQRTRPSIRLKSGSEVSKRPASGAELRVWAISIATMRGRPAGPSAPAGTAPSTCTYRKP